MDNMIATVDQLCDGKTGSQLVAHFNKVGLAEPRLSAALLTGGKASGLAEYNILIGKTLALAGKVAAIFCSTPEEQDRLRSDALRSIGQMDSQFFGPCLVGALLTL